MENTRLFRCGQAPQGVFGSPNPNGGCLVIPPTRQFSTFSKKFFILLILKSLLFYSLLLSKRVLLLLFSTLLKKFFILLNLSILLLLSLLFFKKLFILPTLSFFPLPSKFHITLSLLLIPLLLLSTLLKKIL